MKHWLAALVFLVATIAARWLITIAPPSVTDELGRAATSCAIGFGTLVVLGCIEQYRYLYPEVKE